MLNGEVIWQASDSSLSKELLGLCVHVSSRNFRLAVSCALTGTLVVPWYICGRPFTHLSLYLFVSLSLSVSVCVSLSFCICLCVSLSLYLFVSACLFLSQFASMGLFVHSVRLSLFPCLSVLLMSLHDPYV